MGLGRWPSQLQSYLFLSVSGNPEKTAACTVCNFFDIWPFDLKYALPVIVVLCHVFTRNVQLLRLSGFVGTGWTDGQTDELGATICADY